MLDRKTPPPIHTVKELHLPRPKVIHLDNGIPVYILDYPKQEILKLEVLFRAGRAEEHKRMVSRATARLVREGSRTRTAAEIAEHIDFYGGTFNNPTNLDCTDFVLFSLKKHFSSLLPVFSEAILAPSFPEVELENFVRMGIQELQVDLEKPEVVAYRKITELIFGENHPYGYNSVEADYLALTTSDLVQYYDQWYVPSNCLIFVSGCADEQVLSLVNQHFGQFKREGGSPSIPQKSGKPRAHFMDIPHEGSLQKAIKIGRQIFNKKHPDYNGMFVLNTILGGYFGSRLMANIREKNGFTYNIYSTADAMLHDGCFYIATEVNPEMAAVTRKEIWREMKKLRQKPVSQHELEMVRNYLLGMLLNGLDGVVNTADIVKSLVADDLPLEAFDALVETISSIQPEELMVLAQKYFDKKDFWEVVVG